MNGAVASVTTISIPPPGRGRRVAQAIRALLALAAQTLNTVLDEEQ